METGIVFFVGLILIILDGTFFNEIHLLSLTFNIVLIYACIISIYSKKYEAIIMALIFGFLRDILYGRVLGLNAIIFFVCAYIVYKIKDKIFVDSMMTIFIVILFSTFIESLFSTIFLQDFLYSMGQLNYIIRYYLFYPIINGLMAIFIFLLMKKNIIKMYSNKR